MANILQSDLLVNFLYPFLLIFFISFAILGKSKILGENKQLDSFVSVVVALIFVSAAGYVGFASDMILFLTVGLVVIFVGLMFWGFISGKGLEFNDGNKGLKKFFGFSVLVSIVIAVIVFTNSGSPAWEWIESAYDWMFYSNGSDGFWTNFLLIAFVVGAIVAVVKGGGAVTGGSK